jgi:hypothetical protein
VHAVHQVLPSTRSAADQEGRTGSLRYPWRAATDNRPTLVALAVEFG